MKKFKTRFERPDVDVKVVNHGSIWIVDFLTPVAREWRNANVQYEDWQMWGNNGLAVEPRYLHELVVGMRDAGLEVR